MSTAAPQPSLGKRLIGNLAGAFLGAVLLVAAWAKTLDPASFAAQITREGLDFLLPAMAVALLALAIEVALGSALLLTIRRWWVLGPAAALVAFFLFLTGRSYWRFLHGEVPAEADCGCFGNLVERTPAEAFWQDALLMVPALLLAFVGMGVHRGWPRGRMLVVVLLTVATVVVAWQAPQLPLDDLATRLKPGVVVNTLCTGSEEEGTRVCLDTIVPQVEEGEHFVILADLGDEAFTRHVEQLNAYQWAGSEPPFWVVTAATPEALFAFRWEQGPSFEPLEAPAALLRPLYRTLPRSFRVQDGEVVETYRGLPPPLAGGEGGSAVQAAELDDNTDR